MTKKTFCKIPRVVALLTLAVVISIIFYRLEYINVKRLASSNFKKIEQILDKPDNSKIPEGFSKWQSYYVSKDGGRGEEFRGWYQGSHAEKVYTEVIQLKNYPNAWRIETKPTVFIGELYNIHRIAKYLDYSYYRVDLGNLEEFYFSHLNKSRDFGAEYLYSKEFIIHMNKERGDTLDSMRYDAAGGDLYAVVIKPEVFCKIEHVECSLQE